MNQSWFKKLLENVELAKKSIINNKHEEALQFLVEISELEEADTKLESLKAKSKGQSAELNDRGRIKRLQFIILLIFAITALLVTILELKKVPSTEVEIQVGVSEFTFTLAKKWNIFSIKAETIGLSNLDDVQLEVFGVKQATDFDPESDKPIAWQEMEVAEQLIIHRTQDDWGVTFESKYLNLTSLFIDSAAQITVLHDDSRKNHISFRISGGSIIGSIDIGDTLIVTCSNCVAGTVTPAFSTSTQSFHIIPFINQIEFRDREKTIEISIEIPKADQEATDPILLGKGIAISSINFTRFVGDAKESTLEKDGIIYLSELDNKQLRIREGDFFLIDNLRNFQIRKIQLDKNLLINLQGKVGTLESGAEAFMKSKMPSLLESFQANKSITLIISITIAAFAWFMIFLNQLNFFDRIRREV